MGWIFGEEFHSLCTQKNPFDSRRFFAMRSCVDFPDPSDPSTIMRVPGLSSVEKNVSFLGPTELMSGVFFVGDFFEVAVLIIGKEGRKC